MINKSPTKIITIIIYFLIISLICLILYNVFLITNKSHYSIESPKNSINVGPISIE